MRRRFTHALMQQLPVPERKIVDSDGCLNQFGQFVLDEDGSLWDWLTGLPMEA